MSIQTDLSKYNNSWYDTGASVITRLLWYYTNAIFFSNSFFPFNTLKIVLLKAFGAKVGEGVIIKPSVNIKYPWKLEIGNYVWIGECCWIDNLDNVIIKNNAVLSQGAMLLCGNHNYKKQTFDLVTGPIIIEEGAWIGAKAVVCPGITCYSHAVLSVNSVAINNLEAYGIYQGNPAVKIRERVIS